MFFLGYIKIILIYLTGIFVHELGHIISMLILGGNPTVGFLSVGGTVPSIEVYYISLISGFFAELIFGIIIAFVGFIKRLISIYFGGFLCIYNALLYYLVFSPLLKEGDYYNLTIYFRFNFFAINLALILFLCLFACIHIIGTTKIMFYKKLG